jgi:hypothetical protein
MGQIASEEFRSERASLFSFSRYVLAALEREGKIDRLRGNGCEPAAIRAVRGDKFKRLGRTRATGVLPFPERNGPVVWPRYTIQEALLAA